MIQVAEGNLLKAEAEALVNTVNCVGVMGKGIALQFRQAFPENFRVYKRACDAGELRPGQVLAVPAGTLVGPKLIFNVATKQHWRHGSQLEWIREGVKNLVEEVRAHGIKSVAVPPLGCGNGGLDWQEVRPIIEEAFEAIPEVRVFLFPPKGAPTLAERPVATNRPN
jgi:O-acetyl-ADP-ribose deacetylase (regulator of RNase III)